MDVKTGRLRMRWFRALVLALALSCPLADVWATDPKMKFNIPAGTLGKTLREFTAQAQIHAMYVSTLDGRTVATVATRAVVGRFTPAEALTRMLEGTGVTFEFEHALSVLLRPPPRRATAANAVGLDEEAAFATAREAMEAEPLQQVLVTGSLIRGLEDVTAPLMILGQKEKKQAAYGTVQDVLRTLPQTFGSGANEDFSFNENSGRGVGVNLRGLGMGATLVLVNGRRQPASGVAGDFVDVSTIPWSAVERIDVLADGSSALYGSDAIAGVVNIVMRDALPGMAETQTRLGNALGGASETLLAQSFGHRWEDGKWMFTYQYAERTALATLEREYAADADKRPLGGSNLRSFFSAPGNILNPATQLPLLGIGEDGTLSSTINLYNQMASKDLLPNRQSHSAFFTGSQKLGDRFNLFAEGRYNQRDTANTNRPYTLALAVPASNPFFPDAFGGAPFVLVAYNFLNELGPIQEASKTTTYTGTLGMEFDLFDQWQATLSGSYGKETLTSRGYNLVNPFAMNGVLADLNPLTAFNPFGTGPDTNPAALDAIRSTRLEAAASHILTVSLVMDGPLPDLPMGTPQLAVGLEQRRENLFRETIVTPIFARSAQYDGEVAAAFSELSVPLTSQLNLSLAGRYESYSEFGDTFNSKIGLRWTVSDSLRFRGGWGTSFRNPTLVDLYDTSSNSAALFPLADPNSPSGFSLVLGETGANPNLQEETARTWTAGLDFAPESIPGFTWTTTYYATRYENRIWRFQAPLALESFLTDDKWAALVTHNPPRSEVERICGNPQFVGSVADCLASSPDVILDIRMRNLSSTTITGVDAEIKQLWQTGYGSVNLGLNGNYALSFDEKVTDAAALISRIGTLLNPPKLRLRGVVEWSRHGRNLSGWSGSIATDYFSGFRDESSKLVPRISSLATFDAQLSYRTEAGDAWFGGMSVTLNAINIFDTNPPFIDQEQGYDPTNAKPYGRVMSLMLQKDW